MQDVLNRYLEKRTMTGPWQVTGIKRHDYAGAVVIPACDEEQWLFRTLDSLAANHPEQLASFLVLVVVNQPKEADHPVKIANRRLLEQFTASPLRTRLELGWVDACSEGFELARGGVGSARKLGLDLALRHLDTAIDPLLVSLDADTLVEPNYLEAISDHFASSSTGGAVLPFAHQPAANQTEQRAIDSYELYIRLYLLGLTLAGSPYAFHTIGSAMACRVSAYLGCGGMNRRTGGEDFYFLQSLAKTSGVSLLQGTTVHPSSRLSSRVQFGTGPALIESIGNPHRKIFYPHRAFALLGEWLRTIENSTERDGSDLQGLAQGLNPHLGLFLHRQKFAGAWDRLRRNHHDPPGLLRAFHTWFDSLKTQQLLKTLCQNEPLGMVAAEEAIAAFFPEVGLKQAGDLAEDLQSLRRWQKFPVQAGK